MIPVCVNKPPSFSQRFSTVLVKNHGGKKIPGNKVQPNQVGCFFFSNQKGNWEEVEVDGIFLAHLRLALFP